MDSLDDFLNELGIPPKSGAAAPAAKAAIAAPVAAAAPKPATSSADFLDWLDAPQPAAAPVAAPAAVTAVAAEDAFAEPDNWLEKIAMPAPPPTTTSPTDFNVGAPLPPAALDLVDEDLPPVPPYKTPTSAEGSSFRRFPSAFEDSPVPTPAPAQASSSAVSQSVAAAQADDEFATRADLEPAEVPVLSRRFSFKESDMKIGSPRMAALSFGSGDDEGVDRLVRQFSSTFDDSDISVKPSEFTLSTPPPSTGSPSRSLPTVTPELLDPQAALSPPAEIVAIAPVSPALQRVDSAESDMGVGSFVAFEAPQPVVVVEGTKKVIRRFASAFDDDADDDDNAAAGSDKKEVDSSMPSAIVTPPALDDTTAPPDRQATPGSESGFGFSTEILPAPSEFVFNAPMELTPPVAATSDPADSEFGFSAPSAIEPAQPAAPAEFTFDAPVVVVVVTSAAEQAPTAERVETPESDFGFGFREAPAAAPSVVVEVDDFGFGAPVIAVAPPAASSMVEDFGFPSTEAAATPPPTEPAAATNDDAQFDFGTLAVVAEPPPPSQEPPQHVQLDEDDFGFGFSMPAVPAPTQQRHPSPLVVDEAPPAHPPAAAAEDDFGFGEPAVAPPAAAPPVAAPPVAEDDFGFGEPAHAPPAVTQHDHFGFDMPAAVALALSAAEDDDDFGFEQISAPVAAPAVAAVEFHAAPEPVVAAPSPPSQPQPPPLQQEHDFGFGEPAAPAAHASEPAVAADDDFGFDAPAPPAAPATTVDDDDFGFDAPMAPAAPPAATATVMAHDDGDDDDDWSFAKPVVVAAGVAAAAGDDDDDFAAEFTPHPQPSPQPKASPAPAATTAAGEATSPILPRRTTATPSTPTEDPIREPSPRWQSWAKALGIDVSTPSPIMTLEHRDQECAQVVRAEAPNAADANRALAQLENLWGELGGRGFTRRVSPRTASLLSALVQYHDPDLFRALQRIDADWALHPGLHGMYGGAEPVLALWDAAIVYGVPGFEAPAQGALFFALGLVVANREALLAGTTLSQLGALARSSLPTVKQAIAVGTKASVKSPPSFRVILSQPELDLSLLQGMVVYEAVEDEPAALPPPPPPPPPPPQSSASVTKTSGLFSSLRTLAAKTATTLQTELEARLAGAKHEGGAKLMEKLYVASFPSASALPFELASNVSGLCVGAVHASDGDSMVQANDAVHTVNGASVHLLSPGVAKTIMAQQTSPVLVTFSTVHTDRLHARKLAFTRRVKQFKLLHPRLAAFYGRHGPSKVDKVQDILDLYAGHEEALLQGLGDKYGERVPGDATLRLPLCASTAEEVLQFMPRSPSKQVCFVDVRSEDEVDAMGSMACMLPVRDEAAVLEMLATSKARVFLVASGKHRVMSCADPVAAQAAEAADVRNVVLAADFLQRNKVEYVAMVQGGMCEMMREMRARGMEPQLTGASGGWLQWAADAYSRLDFEDSHSVARYLTAYVHGFEPATAAKSDSVDSAEAARPRKRSLEAVMEKVAATTKWPSWGGSSKTSGSASTAAAHDLGLEEEDDD